ncbi:phospholipase D family protein [Maridesulfovibrio sp.]|uniref:phospholipase D family protein n=1 Tax=Maridesulfovibrio sp. TaxID=2795000 RepID=UPI0029C9F53D|nr:phospholipase D family protein [Maridesulfovibrio sp.]
MKILKTKDIGGAVENCAPVRIAVAFVGVDWNKYVDDWELKEIIVSPTEGSNPKGIQSLVKELSWDNVHFLDKLHCKIYIGEYSAVLGSSNLSWNGLSGIGLEEAAVELSDVSEIDELRLYFSDLKDKAVIQYPTEESKKEALAKLYRIWRQRCRSSFADDEEDTQEDFLNYEVLSDRDFYIAWYVPDVEVEYCGDIVEFKDKIATDMHFADGDQIEAGKWVLCWMVKKDFTPHYNRNPYWLFIDEIFEKAVKLKDSNDEYGYTTVAVMRNDLPHVAEPFTLTTEVVEAFRETIDTNDGSGESHDYLEKFTNVEGIYKVQDTFSIFKDFMADWKEKISG